MSIPPARFIAWSFTAAFVGAALAICAVALLVMEAVGQAIVRMVAG